MSRAVLRVVPALMLALLMLPLSAGAAAPASAPARASQAAVPAERALYEDGPDGRYLLEADWFRRGDKRDVGIREGWMREGFMDGFGRSGVPNAFNARRLTPRGYKSYVYWYRTTFFLPPGDSDTTGWRLRFESVNRRADVYLNGVHLGSHEGAFLPFEIDVTAIRPGVNELVVRVDGRLSETVLPGGGSDRGWWNYGGLLREVYLRRVRTVDLRDLQVIATPGEPAEVTVRGRLVNTSDRTVTGTTTLTLTTPDGTVRDVPAPAAPLIQPQSSATFETRFQVENARLWSPTTPALYELRVRTVGGQLTRAHFGIRRFGVDATGRATLNGKRLALRGASFHEENTALGAALGPPEWEAIVAELKAARADVTRAHYPPHPALLEAFDRHGMLFWEQIPVWRRTGPQLRREVLGSTALDYLRETIVRDRNHASVMTWSVSNETQRFDGGQYEDAYIADAARLARELDPTRLVAADVSLRGVPDSYQVLDAIGLNHYAGWYGHTPLDRAMRGLRRNLGRVLPRFPRQALFYTEFGAEANRRGSSRRKGTYQYQKLLLGKTLAILDREPRISGALVWALRDFVVRPGWEGGNPRPNPPFNHKGLFDRYGVPKPAVRSVRKRFARMAWAARR